MDVVKLHPSWKGFLFSPLFGINCYQGLDFFPTWKVKWCLTSSFNIKILLLENFQWYFFKRKKNAQKTKQD